MTLRASIKFTTAAHVCTETYPMQEVLLFDYLYIAEVCKCRRCATLLLHGHTRVAPLSSMCSHGRAPDERKHILTLSSRTPAIRKKRGAKSPLMRTFQSLRLLLCCTACSRFRCAISYAAGCGESTLEQSHLTAPEHQSRYSS